MYSNKLFAITTLLIAVLSGCSGSETGNQAPKLSFSSQVSFGDSLSDVGTYAVGTVAALKGGQYTINGAGKNWTELMAAQFGLTAPCAAQTGLDGDPAQGFSVTPANHAGCTSYAQGGARVTDPVGMGNKLLGPPYSTLGQLTVPVVTQIQNHLAASGGSFRGDEIIFVMAGANDVFMQLGAVQLGAATPASAVTAMATAATELSALINTEITGKGAKYIVVLNIPDMTITPYVATLDAATKGLVDTLVTTFNAQLKSSVSGNTSVLYVDAYTSSHDEAVNPAIYGLTNVTQTACDLANPLTNPLASSLVCTSNNLIPGVVDHYLFADGVHPTPYGYWLTARLVSKEMIVKGWL